MAQPLDYVRTAPLPRQISLEHNDDFARLTFPPLPDWLIYGSIGLQFIYAAFMTWALVQVVGIFYPTLPDEFRWSFISGFVMYGGLVLIAWVIAMTSLFTYKHKQTPSVLEASDGELTWSYRGWLTTQRRTFSAEHVRKVSFKPIADIFKRKTSGELIISFHHRRNWKRRFATRDAELPDRIVRAFRAALHLPIP